MAKEEFHEDPYNQYTQYDKLPKLLKRFSFAEKMRICYQYSRPILHPGSFKEYIKNQHGPLPWVLETFALLSIEAIEYQNNDFMGKNQNKFINMINAIWNHTPSEFKGSTDVFLKYFFPVTGQIQFSLQESYWIKYFRYWYIFTFVCEEIDMDQTFRSKYGTSYIDFLQLGLFLQCLLGTNLVIPQKVLAYLVTEKFNVVGSQLSVSRDKYITELHQMAGDFDNKSNYIYCIRPSYRYAFIIYDNLLYFPLPHLLIQNITSSLLYRLTEGNNRLREHIGKFVLESYLYKIVSDSDVYDEVKAEIPYTAFDGSTSKSPDVMARLGNDYLYLDSKSSVPPKNLRLLDDSAFENTVNIVTENVVKLYRHICRTPDLLNPFPSSPLLNQNHIWGIVVILEDSYIRRSEIYHAVFKQLSIDENSDTAIWIHEHIKVIDLYSIERQCLCSKSMIDALKRQQSTGHLDDFYFEDAEDDNYSLTNTNFLEFKEMIMGKMDDVAQDMYTHGLLGE